MNAYKNRLAWRENPLPELIRLAWPITVSVLSFSTMSLVDALFVGRISAAALAGVGIAGLMLFTLACFSVGLFRGLKVLVSQACGAGREQEVATLLGAGLWTALGLSLITIVVGLFVRDLLPFVSASAAAAEAADSYFFVRLWATPLVLSYATLREFSYGRGNTRTPMVAAVIANGCNIVLDWLLISVFEFGPAGAAWASVVAQAAQASLLWFAVRVPFSELRAGAARIGEVLRVGWPIGLQFLVDVSSFALMATIISGISEVEMAAHQLTLHALHLSFLPAYAIGEAASVLAGRAVGAGDDRLVYRVARVGVSAAGVYTGAFTLLLLLFSGSVASLLTSDPAVASAAGGLLLFGATFQVIDGAAVVGGGVLRGTGDVRFPAIVAVVTAWACTPTACWFLGVRGGMGALGGWIGISLELTVLATVFWWRILRGGWIPAAKHSRRKLEG